MTPFIFVCYMCVITAFDEVCTYRMLRVAVLRMMAPREGRGRYKEVRFHHWNPPGVHSVEQY